MFMTAAIGVKAKKLKADMEGDCRGFMDEQDLKTVFDWATTSASAVELRGDAAFVRVAAIWQLELRRRLPRRLSRACRCRCRALCTSRGSAACLWCCLR